MPKMTLEPLGTDATSSLSAQTAFYVEKGKVGVSTDGGTTLIPFDQGEKFIMSSGLTVTIDNLSGNESAVRYMDF